jgi:hypothetical protein
VNFTQVIYVRASDADALVRLLAEWDHNQADNDINGYIGTHVLRDINDPERFLIVAEFAEVEGDLTAAEEAARNNERPETQEWARRLLEVIDGDPEYQHYDELYRTG